MELFAIENFYHRFRLIVKRKKQYRCIEKHFTEEFSDTSDAEFFIKGSHILGSNDKKVLKCRVKSCSGHGDSSGFRVIFHIDRIDNKVTFLDIYPKTGKLGQDNYDHADLKDWLEQLKEEKENNELFTIELKSEKIEFTPQKVA